MCWGRGWGVRGCMFRSGTPFLHFSMYWLALPLLSSEPHGAVSERWQWLYGDIYPRNCCWRVRKVLWESVRKKAWQVDRRVYRPERLPAAKAWEGTEVQQALRSVCLWHRTSKCKPFMAWCYEIFESNSELLGLHSHPVSVWYVCPPEGEHSPVTLFPNHMFVSCKSEEGLLLKDVQVPEPTEGSFWKAGFPKLGLPRCSSPATAHISAQGATALRPPLQPSSGYLSALLVTQVFPVLLLRLEHKCPITLHLPKTWISFPLFLYFVKYTSALFYHFLQVFILGVYMALYWRCSLLHHPSHPQKHETSQDQRSE